MKKLSLLMIAACTFVACEKGNGGSEKEPERRIVSIEQTHVDSEVKVAFNMEYNGQGQMTKYILTAGEASNTTADISYSDTKVTINYKGTFVDEYNGQVHTSQDKGTIEASLNAQKYAQTIKLTDIDIEEDGAEEAYVTEEAVSYNGSGEVIEVVEKYISSAEQDVNTSNATWSEGNMTAWKGYGVSDIKYNTESNNLTNLDINWLLHAGEDLAFVFAGRGYSSILALTGYCGKRSKNYIVEQSEKYNTSSTDYDNVSHFEYTFDSEKYPTEIKCYSTRKNAEKMLYSTIKISYNK